MIAADLSHYGSRLRDWLACHRARIKPVLMTLAVLLFCGGLFLSLRATPEFLDTVRIRPLILITLCLVPCVLFICALDFQMLARLCGVKAPLLSALEVIIYTHAANMLPIPGSITVRLAALKARGVALQRSGGVMLLFTLLWCSAAFCYSAAWLAFQAPMMIAAPFAATGFALLVFCVVAISRFRLDPKAMALVGGLRFSLVAFDALILLVAVHAVGGEAAYQQTAILVVSSCVASIVPAGIGVRETVIAMLAPFAGIDPATGFLAGAAARFSAMAFLAVASVFIMAARRFRGGVA